MLVVANNSRTFSDILRGSVGRRDKITDGGKYLVVLNRGHKFIRGIKKWEEGLK